MAKILVTGSTGNVGSRLVQDLLSRGQSVRALTRNRDSSRLDSRVEIAVGDFMDKASLRKALAGVSKMFLLAPGNVDMVQQEANAIDAAKEAGLELLVYQSVGGAQYKASIIPRWHRASEERIEASGIPYTFLRPGSFSSNALYWIPTIQLNDTVYDPLGNTSLPPIDPEDLAAVAAIALTTPGHAGKIYELSGPESMTPEQQVAVLSSVLGRQLTYVNVPDSAARESMLGMGMSPGFVDAMIDLFETLRGIGHIDPTGDFKAVTGREPRTFRQWAEANSAAFTHVRPHAARG